MIRFQKKIKFFVCNFFLYSCPKFLIRLLFTSTISEQKRILNILEQNMKKHEKSPSAQV